MPPASEAIKASAAGGSARLAGSACLGAPLRRLVEDTWVMKDWFELYVAQNVVLDGVLFGLAYKEVDQALERARRPCGVHAHTLSGRVGARRQQVGRCCMKVAAAESPENKAL